MLQSRQVARLTLDHRLHLHHPLHVVPHSQFEYLVSQFLKGIVTSRSLSCRRDHLRQEPGVVLLQLLNLVYKEHSCVLLVRGSLCQSQVCTVQQLLGALKSCLEVLPLTG